MKDAIITAQWPVKVCTPERSSDRAIVWQACYTCARCVQSLPRRASSPHCGHTKAQAGATRPRVVQEKREEGGQFDTLLQVTVGQEDVEDTILRDIHRTFPEHPRFLSGQGQQELFNVLKAYSMVDIEVRARRRCVCCVLLSSW